MTQQYLAGELSVLLGRLQAVASDEMAAREAAGLRREAETWPPAALTSVVVRALALGDDLCWDRLALGDVVAFSRQCVVCAQLREFGLCAGLLGED